MTSNALQLDAYIRVSKVRGRSGESFISPAVQREQIEAWARAHGHELIWHEPEMDISGGTMSRPIFDQIIQRIRDGESDGVIVAKLDRFARTLVGALNILEEFERTGAVLVSVADNIDLSTPMGKAFMRILLVFAELERDRISESWKTASSNAVARGIHISKFVPVGYERRPDKRLAPGAQAPAIKEAFQMRASHHSYTEIARRLDETAPRPGSGRWTRSRVERVIKNRVYRGEAYRGANVNHEAHPAIVTPAEWQAANLAPVRAIARGDHPSLLGGILRCAGCRYLLAPHNLANKSNKTPIYRCRTIHSAGACPSPTNVNARQIEEYVENVWRQQMADQAVAIQPDSESLQRATDALTEAERELDAFASDLTARRVLGRRFHAALEARAVAVEQAQTTVQRAMTQSIDGEVIESYGDLSVPERRRILGSSIDAVIVTRAHWQAPLGERVTILWRGEGPEDLPRRGRDNGPIRPYAP
ncbi:MAG TPA: recombinase family protein [Solirubrobacteraceae bacterium]|nr:recombinase family protein [Solirubrobacteraceae bacterium]